MRKTRDVLFSGVLLACFADGCDRGLTGESQEAINKQNIDDELKAMENAKNATKGEKGRKAGGI